MPLLIINGLSGVGDLSSNVRVSPQWYKTFFNALAADFWNGAITEAWTARETAFLHQVFGEGGACEKRLLDVLCGAGRHIPALSLQGYVVNGVDISPTMLQLARKRCEASVPEFRGGFYQLDAMAGLAESFDPSLRFDGAYCLGNSFGYADARHSRKFLSETASLLRPGARLVLNSSMFAETLLPNWETRMDMVAGGVHAAIENLEYDPIESRLITRFEFEADTGEEGDGKEAPVSKETHLVCHYIFTSGEIIRWLDTMGCDCLGIYGSPGGKTYALGDEQWYGVFQKRLPET